MMLFVKGSPFKGSGSYWYVKLDRPEAEAFVASILRGNAEQFLCDKHADITSCIAAQSSLGLAMQLEDGFHDRRGYYANRRGGMCPELYDTVQETEADDWPVSPDVRICRWPNGRHYYVRVNGREFEWRGKAKWNTAREAEAAVAEWRKSK